MVSKYHLGVIDITVIVLMLLISAVIGIHFRYKGKKTVNLYLMGGKKMSRFPVILSVSVTLLSAISMIGTPAEVYRYGVQCIVVPFSVGIGILFAAYVFIPVYFQCGVSTVYEFLEKRFGKTTRYTISAVFILQMVIYISCVLYAPVLALSGITNLSLEMGIIVFGSVCAFYCAVGGLRGVLWTDVFQSILMALCLISVYVVGIPDGGGITNIYQKLLEGQRMQFNFNFDITARYSMWNCIIYGFLYGFGCYGTNQVEVQRLLSLGDSRKAKTTLIMGAIPVAGLYIACSLTGLILFAIYSSCDPILNKEETGLQKYDQLIPYYIVTRLSSIPGVAGLCVAGIFCGSMSTISSALNSLATVTIVDLLRPFPSAKRFSESKVLLFAKGLSLFYGCICIGLAFVFSYVSSIKQISNMLISMLDGPVSALFTVGVLSTRVSQKCATFGFLVGFATSSWISYGVIFSGYVEKNLPLSTSACTSEKIFDGMNDTFINCTDFGSCSSTASSRFPPPSEIFVLHKVGFYWIRIFGYFATILGILFAVLLTGWKTEVIPSDSECLSPVTRFWMSPKGTVNTCPNSSMKKVEMKKMEIQH